MRRALRHLAILSALPAWLAAQTIQQRIAAVDNGTVHLSYLARPGVCGSGPNRISTDDRNGEWEGDCESQPVRVALTLQDRRVIGVRTYVGGRWRAGSAAIDRGTVRPQEAAAYLLELAQHSAELTGEDPRALDLFEEILR